MTIITYISQQIKIAEVISDDIVIQASKGSLDSLGNIYQDFNKIIIHDRNITPEFFNLKNEIVAEMLQRFSHYRVRLAIIGDFKKFPGKSTAEFIYESNKRKVVNFVSPQPEAIKPLSD
ncbi:MAG: hypothetical protein JWM28_1602 [Chitinophagaceae bacterium]|nr:hypothetical protein [Chitinophagaceae bacterium]